MSVHSLADQTLISRVTLEFAGPLWQNRNLAVPKYDPKQPFG
jgi:hypothetical protein